MDINVTKGAIVLEGHVQGLSNTRSLGELGIPVYVIDVVHCLAQHSRFCAKEKWKMFEKLIEKVDRNNAFLVINYHNNNFSNSDFLEYNTDYIQMIKILKSRNSHFMTMKEAYQEILKRNN